MGLKGGMRCLVAIAGLMLALASSAATAAAREPEPGIISLAQAEDAPPEAAAAALAAWDEASYGSLPDFLSALQSGRYTVLVFRRMSADLREGNIAVLDPILERYFDGRKVRHGLADPLVKDAFFLIGVEQDMQAGIAHANKSTDLSIPEFAVKAVIARAKHIVRRIYGLSGGNDAPARQRITPPEGASAEVPEETERRAENTGLLHDVADFVVQPHLQFLVGGVGVTQKARLVVEVLKIARRDNYIVDQATVAAFFDRLVEGKLLAPADRAAFIEQVLIGIGLREPEPAEEAATSSTPPEPVTEEPPELDASPPPQSVDDPPSAAGQEDRSQTDEIPAVRPAPKTGGQRTTVVHRQPPAPEPPVAAGPSDPAGPLVTLEAGMGVTVPAGDGDLSGIAGAIARDPGIAARFGLGVTWLNAVGPAHLSLGLVGVAGQTKADRLVDRGGPPTLTTSGRAGYVGVLPFASIELPVFDGINARFGAGLGVAYQDLSVVDGGLEIVDADGASLIAQFGGGLRAQVTPCMDVGIDVFATYLDDVGGRTNLGAPVRYGGTWDVAAYLGVRVALAGPGGSRAGLFSSDSGGSAHCH